MHRRVWCALNVVRRMCDLTETFVFIINGFPVFRYAEEVVGCFRFMILYVLGMTTVTITLFGILLIVVCGSSGIFFIYAWPADYLQDAVSIYVR